MYGLEDGVAKGDLLFGGDEVGCGGVDWLAIYAQVGNLVLCFGEPATGDIVEVRGEQLLDLRAGEPSGD